MMDGDFSHSPKYLPAMINETEEYDLVIGSRYIQGGGVTNKWEMWRKCLSRFANCYLRAILGKEIRDWTGGFNLIKINILKKIDMDSLYSKGYAFIFGLKYSLLKNKAKEKEIPIIFEERENGKSKMNQSIIFEAIFAPWKIIFKKH